MRAAQNEFDMWQFLTNVIAKRRLRPPSASSYPKMRFAIFRRCQTGDRDNCRNPNRSRFATWLYKSAAIPPKRFNLILLKRLMWFSIKKAWLRSSQSDVSQPPANMLGKLGLNVRAVYGHGEFLRGPMGSSRRFGYGTIFPHIQPMLEKLFALEFGTAKEV